MSDKFRTVFPIAVSFANGEQPTAKKINAISSQSKNGLAVIEKALGDLWNQSGDSISSSYPNKIPNLSRAVGDFSLLSSTMQSPDFTGVASVRVVQAVDRGSAEIKLDYIAENDGTLTSSIQALHGNSGAFTGSSVAIGSVTTDNAWHLNTTSNKIQLGSAIHASNGLSYIEYNVLAANFPKDTGEDGAFNLIPNIDQTDWNGIKIVPTVTANKYLLVLPFRRPLSSMADKAPDSSLANVAVDSTVRFYGPTEGYTPVAGITDVDFYRYSPSKIIRDLFISPVAGTTIPSGLIYLWNNSTQTIVEGVTFKVPEVSIPLFGQVPWVLQVEGVMLDALFSGLTSTINNLSEDTPSSYKSNFSLLIASSSLSGAVAKLKEEILSGSKSVGVQKAILHSDLKNTQPLAQTRHPISFPNSFVERDEHSHLLSRNGSALSSNTALWRDRFNNAIVGNLLIGNGTAANNYQATTGASYYIYFGRNPGPGIRGHLSGFSSLSGSVDSAIDINTSARIDGPLILFNTSNQDGPILKSGLSASIGTFDFEGTHAGSFWTKRIVLNGTIRSSALFDGSTTDTNGSTRYIDIDTSTSNLVKFKGDTLDISGTSGTTNPVAIGTSNSSTHLRLINNKLEFGSSSESITYSSGSDTFTFTGNIDVKSSTGSCNTMLVPANVNDSPGGTVTFNQLSDFLTPAGEKSVLIEFDSIPGSATYNDLIYFPLTHIPAGATIETVRINGQQYASGGGLQFRVGISNNVSSAGTNTANSSTVSSASPGPGVKLNYDITLASSGYTVNANGEDVLFLCLGIHNTIGATRSMDFKIFNIQVTYTYTKLRI